MSSPGAWWSATVPQCAADDTLNGVLLVDAANVVGSRPNGWWRDRPGAARGLHERLLAAVAAQRLAAEIVLVLEGAARAGVAAGAGGDVRVVHAPAAGDDELVRLAADAVRSGEPVTVVTADRGLRARVSAAGAEVVGPGWLLERV